MVFYSVSLKAFNIISLMNHIEAYLFIFIIYTCIIDNVQGSIEAIRQALQVLPQENVSLKFLLQATGDVSSSDIDLAVASKAIVLGFNVKAPGSVKSYAENKGVEIRLYRVIYELIDDVRNAMEGLLEPVEVST